MFFYRLHPGSLRQLSFFLADTEMNLIIFFIKNYFSFSLDTWQTERALLRKVHPAGAAPLSACYAAKKRSTRIWKTPKSCTPL
jgi:RimJ/RimL family protein N-acetyltransferase